MQSRIAPALARLAARRHRGRALPPDEAAGQGGSLGLQPAAWPSGCSGTSKKYDVVHLQYVWCMSSICGSILGRIHGIPLVITPHESLTDYDIDVASKSRIKRLVKLTLRQLYLRTADRLVFMSELEERDTRYGSTPAQLISHAVQEEAVPVDPPDRTGADGSLRIAFPRPEHPEEGHRPDHRGTRAEPRPGLEAPHRRPSGHRRVRRETTELRRGPRRRRERRVARFPRQADGSVRGGCDVLAMPSAYEGFGMVAAEAMCPGVPVIVPRNSGVAEIVTEVRSRDRDAGVLGRQPRTARS